MTTIYLDFGWMRWTLTHNQRFIEFHQRLKSLYMSLEESFCDLKAVESVEKQTFPREKDFVLEPFPQLNCEICLSWLQGCCLNHPLLLAGLTYFSLERVLNLMSCFKVVRESITFVTMIWKIRVLLTPALIF